MNPRFLEGATWGFAGEPVAHIETHAAHVFLVADRAFKVKKAIVLPYLDFSTLERRRAVLAHELEVNRRFAPQIYDRVIEVEGEPVLVMHRFDNRLLLSAMVGGGRLGDAIARGLAEAAANAHDAAEAAQVSGSAVMAGLGIQLARAFMDSPDVFPAAEARAFASSNQAAFDRLTPLLDRRSTGGLVRRCHGDMHCGNVVLLDGVPTLFDAIEFSEKIATIDVLYDLAFLVMDLLHHGELRAANIVLNRYLSLRRQIEDMSGLSALPLFLSTRAGVRALVAADRAHEQEAAEARPTRGEALSYFRAAAKFLAAPPPRLLAIGGLSGTGKSTLAAALAPSVGPAPGAIHLRSDVERKVLAGVAETARLDAGHYGPEASRRVYEVLLTRARQALAAGHGVILDAVFAAPGERQAAELLARELRVPFHGFWLKAGAEVLKSRVTARRGDASDADAVVVERQLGYDLGAISWQGLEAGPDAAIVLESATAVLGAAGALAPMDATLRTSASGP